MRRKATKGLDEGTRRGKKIKSKQAKWLHWPRRRLKQVAHKNRAPNDQAMDEEMNGSIHWYGSIRRLLDRRAPHRFANLLRCDASAFDGFDYVGTNTATPTLLPNGALGYGKETARGRGGGGGGQTRNTSFFLCPQETLL